MCTIINLLGFISNQTINSVQTLVIISLLPLGFNLKQNHNTIQKIKKDEQQGPHQKPEV
jgi:hypothetical protein